MIRIGLLGASRIARGAVIKPAEDLDGVVVSRVAASSTARAEDYAREHDIPGIEADYGALVTSNDVDLVYNALPPSGHREWSVRALEAGKHVLCEKPFALNATEAEAMVAAADASGVQLIEAFHYRYHPLFERVLEILRAGAIGAVRSVAAHFNVPIKAAPGELRYDPALGGGALMDLGCYPLHWVRTVAGSEPEVIAAEASWHDSGVDESMRATLRFGGGIEAVIHSSMQASLPEGLDAEMHVVGESGTLTVINPLAPHLGHELIVENSAGRSSESVQGETTYHHQLQHVLDVINNGATPLTGGADAVGTMAAIDRIYAAAGRVS